MARFNPAKPAYLALLDATYQSLVRAAVMASDADRKAVDLAGRALKFAGLWTNDTTERSRRLMMAEHSRLTYVAENAPTTPLNRAALAYAEAIEAFNEPARLHMVEKYTATARSVLV